MIEKNHCNLCNKNCSSPDYNPDRFILDTTWEGKLSLPAHFMDCPIFRNTAKWNKNIIPLVTT